MLTLCSCGKDINKDETSGNAVSSTSAITITSDHPTLGSTLLPTSSSKDNAPS